MVRKSPDMAFLAEMLRETGVDADPDIKALNSLKEDYSKLQARRDREAQDLKALVHTIHYMHSMDTRQCAYCKRTFRTTLCYDSYCSEQCWIDEFDSKSTVTWENLRSRINPPASFWDYEPSLKMSPDAVDRFYEFAKLFVDEVDKSRRRQEAALGSAEVPEDSEPDYLSSLVYSEDDATLQMSQPVSESEGGDLPKNPGQPVGEFQALLAGLDALFDDL